MAKGKLKIHSENILPIIKKSLYSDKDIFVRELVSNSCDAMTKMKVLRDEKVTDFLDEELRIDITIDKEAKTIRIVDTGLGMNEVEVKNYIAQLAFSGAEEFVEKYSKGSEIIGHFGLGFYSSFMVSKQVDIDTKSYQDEPAVFWSSEGTYDYTIKKGKRETRGTEITLHVDDDSDEFLEESKLGEILRKYCSYLPFPIFLGEQQINSTEPLWLKNASDLTDADYISFYHHLYPMEPDPIFWIHLNVDYPFNLKGILYFPKINQRFDFGSSHIQLYCNRVFVSDNCKDLIPDHLMVLRGAIDSPDIPLNVSRSYLQMDKTVRSLGQHVSKKVADKLASLYQSDAEKFQKAWPDLEMIVKLSCLHDEKFYERVKDALLWKTVKGEWTTVESLDTKKVFYTMEPNGDSQFLDMYKAKGIEVIIAPTPLDTPIMNLLEGKIEGLKFQRIDGGIDESLLDTDREANTEIAALIKSHLVNVNVEAKSLTSDELPGFVMLTEENRRMRDYLALSKTEMPIDMLSEKTFVVNTNNPLIVALSAMNEKDPDLAKDMINQVYQLALLSQKELHKDDFESFIRRSNSVLSKLARHATT